jgi:hypothetical protein
MKKSIFAVVPAASFSSQSKPSRLSLDAFFSSYKNEPTSYHLSDDKALQYMRMAAELSLISRFKDEQEML